MSEPLRGVVFAHADLARALVGAVREIVGESAGLMAVSNAGGDRAALAQRLEEAVGGGPALVFADLAGGSCASVASAVARGRPGLRVVTGVNLPMLLEFAFHRDEGPDAAARRAALSGRAAVKEVGP